jgi:hypothetical protein
VGAIIGGYLVNFRTFATSSLVLLCTLALSGLAHAQIDAGAPLPPDLVAYWPLNGNYNDVVGGVNGKDEGNVSFTIGADAALNFDGSSGRIAIPDSPRLALTHSLAITAWININAYPSDHAYILFRGDDRVGLDPYNFYINSDGTLGFMVNDDSGGCGSVKSTPSIPLHTWTFVAGSIDDATGILSVYINGQLTGQAQTDVRSYAVLDPTQTPGLGIGNVQSGNYGFYFNGLIRQVKLYDSTDPDELPLGSN